MKGFVKPQWQLVADDAIQLGGCKLVTENSRVDFTISSRLTAIIEDAFDEDPSLSDIVDNNNAVRAPNKNAKDDRQVNSDGSDDIDRDV